MTPKFCPMCGADAASTRVRRDIGTNTYEWFKVQCESRKCGASMRMSIP